MDFSPIFKATTFITNIDNIAKFLPVSKRCFDCYLRKMGRCTGGCLSYKMPAIMKIRNDISKEFMTEF